MPVSRPLPPLPRLYREHFGTVWASLRRLGVDDRSLEDATHDVFVVVHRRRGDFEGRSSVRTWLLGIARRVASRYRRTEFRARRRRAALAAVAPPGEDLHEQIVCRQGWAQLMAFLGELDDGKREAFVLGEIERLGRRELGKALGISPNTAYSRLRAARARFEERFGTPPSEAAHRVLAAGRGSDPPRQSRRRVWLALSSLPGAIQPAVSVGGFGVPLAITLAIGALTLGAIGVSMAPPDASDDAEVTAASSPPSSLPSSPPSSSSSPPGSLPDSAASVSPSAGDPRSRALTGSAPVPQTTPPRRRPVAVSPSTTAAVPPLARSSPSSGAAAFGSSSAEPDTEAPRADLEVETALLRRAQAALAAGRVGGARAILEEHARRFPRGAFEEERMASMIVVGCRQGRTTEARRQARRLLDRYPHSVYLERPGASCVGEMIRSEAAGD